MPNYISNIVIVELTYNQPLNSHLSGVTKKWLGDSEPQGIDDAGLLLHFHDSKHAPHI